MIQDLFLAYANHSFRESSENLRTVFEAILEHVSPDPPEYEGIKVEPLGDLRTRTKQLVDEIIYFASLKDAKFAEKRLKTERKKQPLLADHAFEIVYGYRTDSCEGCIWIGKNPGLFKQKGLVDTTEINCLECAQLTFICVLLNIVEGKEYKDMMLRDPFKMDERVKNIYNDIARGEREFMVGDAYRAGRSFLDLLETVHDNVVIKTVIRNNQLRRETMFDMRGLLPNEFSRYTHYTPRHRFELFLNSVMGFSLVEFLLNNDRRKLKRCAYCGQFFVAKDIRRQRCSSPECEKTYQRLKKQSQRRRDPVKYY